MEVKRHLLSTWRSPGSGELKQIWLGCPPPYSGVEMVRNSFFRARVQAIHRMDRIGIRKRDVANCSPEKVTISCCNNIKDLAKITLSSWMSRGNTQCGSVLINFQSKSATQASLNPRNESWEAACGGSLGRRAEWFPGNRSFFEFYRSFYIFTFTRFRRI